MLKGIGLFVAIIGLLTAAFAFAVAHGDEPTTPNVVDIAKFARVITIYIDDQPVEVEFISVIGEAKAFPYAQCAADVTCRAVHDALATADKAFVLKLKTPGTQI